MNAADHRRLVRAVGLFLRGYEPPPWVVVEQARVGGSLVSGACTLLVSVTLAEEAEPAERERVRERVERDIARFALDVYLHRDIYMEPKVTWDDLREEHDRGNDDVRL